jgi:hypothetical protein
MRIRIFISLHGCRQVAPEFGKKRALSVPRHGAGDGEASTKPSHVGGSCSCRPPALGAGICLSCLEPN